MRSLTLVLLFLAGLVPAFAQSEDDGSNSFIVSLIEDSLSADNRKVRLRGIEGLLASNASVAEITVADDDGVWLRITDAQIVWTRSALLQRRLNISSLKAAEIEVSRRPLPDPAPPSLEAEPFSLPQLPLSVEIGELEAARIVLGETVLGQSAELAIKGALSLIDGSLSSKLELDRLDARGRFDLAAEFARDTRALSVDLSFDEPEGGIVAGLLNLEGRPALAMTVKGDGQLEDIELVLSATTDGTQALSGRLRLAEASGGIGFNADVTGALGDLIAPSYRAFFEGESKLVAQGLSRTGGGVDLESFDLSTAALDINGTASTTADGFLSRAVFSGTLGDGDSPTVLPFGDGITIRGAALNVSYGEDPSGLWQASIIGDDIKTEGFDADRLNLAFQGTIDGIDTPEARQLTVNAIGDLAGIRAATRELEEALGDRISFQLASRWQPGQYRIDRARFGTQDARLELEGEIVEYGFQGDIGARIGNLAAFGGLMNRPLSGSVDLVLNGQLKPLAGSFDLGIDGTSDDLRLGIATLDDLMAGKTELGGRILRNETGFRTQNLSLSNPQFAIASDGILATDRADLTFNATLNDLATLNAQAAGAVSLTGTAVGEDGRIRIESGIDIPDGRLLGRSLEDVAARFEGGLESGKLGGRLTGAGQLDREPLSLFAWISVNETSQSVNALDVSVGPSRLTGDLGRDAEGLFRGGLNLTSPDVSLLGTLFLREATGQASIALEFQPNLLGQHISATARLVDLETSGIALNRASLDAEIENALGVPTVAGRLDFTGASAGGIDIRSGYVTAGGRGKRTDFTIFSELANETALNATGALIATEAGYDLELSRLDVDRGSPIVRLEDTTTVRIAGETISLDQFGIAVGDGRVRAKGQINGDFDVDLEIDAVPLSLANAFRDDLGLNGSVSGAATIGGTQAAPDIGFDLAATAISAAALEAAGLPGFDLAATGRTNGNALELDARLSGPQALDSTVSGTVLVDTMEMVLDGQLNAFPLVLIDRAAGRQGLRGTVTGAFELRGTPQRPQVDFDLDGRNISLTVMRENAIQPLAFTGNGRFANGRINLPEMRISGADATNFTLSGRLPVSANAGGMDVSAQGTLPLSVLNVALARNGLSASGAANVSIRARGPLTAPDLRGTLALGGGTFVSSTANVRLEDVNIRAGFEGDSLFLSSASARNSRGGTIDARGSISIDPTRGFPIDLTTTVTDLRYTDGRLATALASGQLRFTGELMRRSLISGNVEIEELEFSLPQQLGTKQSYQLDVRHVNVTPRVQAALDLAGKSIRPVREAQPDSDIAFDVEVTAPNQVFVRGRGVDAELGGSLKLGGTTRNLKPLGQFDLIRGRINILARRIELDEGYIRLEGNLDPLLYLQARTVADDVEANVTLEGPASDPVLSFSSVPDLPDDEVLARLVFDRSLSDLSPLQVAQLAAAAGELSGRTGPSFFSQLRDATGLDDLDFETDNEGTTTVRVGKYIQDNIYSSIEADNQGASKATINLDINQNFTARGTLDNEGNTSFGIFFEKDY